MNTKIVYVVMALALFAAPVSAYTDGASATIVANETTNITAAGTITPAGGYVYNLNLYGETQTQNWSGLYGNVSGMLTLRGSSGKKMYAWTWPGAGNSSGTVFATTNVAPSWNNVLIANGTVADTVFGFGPNASDKPSLTYTATSTQFSVGNTVIPSTANAALFPYVNGLPQTSNFENDVLKLAASPVTRDDIVFGGKITGKTTNFKNTTSDFQLLVPKTAGETYSLYMELK